jgi:hypothetical protein
MIEIQELNTSAIEQFLEKQDYGHLACSLHDEPYVVPIHFAYSKPFVYVYTTEGKKSEILAQNPRVCLQIEEVIDNGNWTSVIIYGEAERLTQEDLKAEAIQEVVNKNPTLTPAVSIRWMDNWVRENIEAIYRIIPTNTTGRATINRGGSHSRVVPNKSGSTVL